MSDIKLGQKLFFIEGEDFDSVLNFDNSNFAKYEIPKEIRFVEEFPRSAIGKINKNALVPKC